MKSSLNEKWIVCRVCLQQPKEKMQTIFSQVADQEDLTDMILVCGGVPIKKFDHYPDKICSRCLTNLRVAHKFRVTCQRSHNHLSKFIAPVVVDKPSDEIEESSLEILANEVEESQEITLKLEPQDCGVKEESDVLEEDVYIDIYESLDNDDDNQMDHDVMEEIFEGGQNENELAMNDGMSAEIEYLEEVLEEDEVTTSDEEFVPMTKAKTKKNYSRKSPSRKLTTARQKRLTAADIAGGAVGKKQPTKSKGKKDKPTQFICDICGNIYRSQGRLTEHIKVHTGLKPHECEICGHAFAQTQQLARHMNTHTGNRPYKCSYCPAAFADLSTRNKHHRIHTNERPYICDVCGKTFTYTNTLKFHKMIHTGEKPHTCDICGKGFLQAYKLRNHKITHEKKGAKMERVKVETFTRYPDDDVVDSHILEL